MYQGLVAQGRTIAETLEIARDVAKKLFEAQDEESGFGNLPGVLDSFDYPLVIGVSEAFRPILTRRTRQNRPRERAAYARH